MVKNIERRLRKLQFEISFFSIFVNTNFLIRRALWFEIQSWAKSVRGDVLDFGCGSKPYESLFNNCSRYIGIDVKISGHNHQASKVDVYFDGATIPFGDNEFDAIVAFEVFEHLKDPDKILLEFKRVLRPGGQIFLSTPFIYGEHETPFDFQRWTSEGMNYLIQKNGLKVQYVKKLNENLAAVFHPIIDQFLNSTSKSLFKTKRLIKFPLIFPLNSLLLIISFFGRKNGRYFTNLSCVAKNN